MARSKVIIPFLTFILITALLLVPLDVGNFETIFASVIVIIVSAIEYKKELFTSLGFYRKHLNLKNLLVTAPLVSIVLFLVYYFILLPGITYMTGQAIDYLDFRALLQGNTPALLNILPFVWISAGFGEEIIWRGYFMRQFTKLFGESTLSMTINIILFGVIFGLCHSYQGITGQIVTGILGSVLAIIFYSKKYDLWFNIAIHGFFDTLALWAFYKGWL